MWTMTHYTSIGIVAFALSMVSTPSIALAYETDQLQTSRGNVQLYRPAEIDPDSPLPLILSLHGFTGNGNEHENYFKLRNQVDSKQFLLCVPNGLQDPQGNRFWNATDACCDWFFQQPDDSGYLRGLIDQVISEYPVDMDSIHVTGHSNGGFMSYRMACDHADIISSVASLAGSTYNDLSDCDPSQAVHVLQIHGTNDTAIDYNGGCFLFVCYPGARECIDIWSGYNQCTTQETSGENLDLDGSISGAETMVTILDQECNEGGSSELWTIQNGSHGPSFNGNFAPALVDWLLEHRRSPEFTCASDFNEDGVTDGEDLGGLISAWGQDSQVHDLDADGKVDGVDLSLLLAAWGDCEADD